MINYRLYRKITLIQDSLYRTLSPDSRVRPKAKTGGTDGHICPGAFTMVLRWVLQVTMMTIHTFFDFGFGYGELLNQAAAELRCRCVGIEREKPRYDAAGVIRDGFKHLWPDPIDVTLFRVLQLNDFRSFLLPF